ncbi:MAG: CPBP family intramembrane metalloprotease [Chloroflexi bacterium]|nr:CPBP family intramembrane metalloprotease [Chloroflexota bacterium]
MPILFFLGLAILLTFISFATYRTGQLLKEWEPEENLLLSPFENGMRLVLVGLCFGLGLLSGQEAAVLGWTPTQPWKDAAIGLAIGAAIPLVLLPPTLWVQRHRPEWHSDVVLRSIRPRNRGQWPAVLLALLPVALLEELIFRSLLLGGLSPYVNVAFFAVAVSIYFGLLHLPQGEWGVIGVTLVSLLLSGLFLWRASLLLVVIAHWTANVGQLALTEIIERRDMTRTE